MYVLTYIGVMVVVANSYRVEYGEFCLEQAIAFTAQEHKCNFFKSSVDVFFRTDTHECQSKCRVEINGFGHDTWLTYQLKELIVPFGKSTLKKTICSNNYRVYLYMYIYCSAWKQDAFWDGGEFNCRQKPSAYCIPLDQTCICQCQPGYLMVTDKCLNGNLALNAPCQFNVQCSQFPLAFCVDEKCSCIEGYSFNPRDGCLRDNVVVGGPCFHDNQCTGTANSEVCERDVCTCKMGYISLDQYCYEGNVSLDRPCSHHAQCLGFPFAGCIDGNCTCITGYMSENSSKCFLRRQINEEAEIHVMGDQQDSSFGTTVGVLFGGVLLGILITIVIVFIIYKRIQHNASKRQRDEPRVVFADNSESGDARIERNVVIAASRDNRSQRKVVNVPPYSHSDESVEYSNVPKTSRRKLTNEDVYNHLNEKEERDDDDYYDHASAATGHVRNMSDYSRMRDMGNGSGSTAAKGTDNYFTLEQR